MANIFDYINIQNELNAVEDKIQPLITKKENLSIQLKNILEHLDEKVIDVITRHLWSNMSEEERDNATAKRDEFEKISIYSFVAMNLPFHPFIDRWRITSYSVKDDDECKIKFTVVCDREANHISGLMTYYIPHVTDWIDLKEFKI